MDYEIERRFLVVTEALPDLFSVAAQRIPIVQGYLAYEPNVVRIRIAHPTSILKHLDGPIVGTNSWCETQLTVKGAGTIKRPEVNCDVLRERAESLLDLCPYVVRKLRTILYLDGMPWAIDQFQDGLEGLWLAEIELRSEDQEFARPPWLGEEVTEDKRYQNINLARYGIPK